MITKLFAKFAPRHSQCSWMLVALITPLLTMNAAAAAAPRATVGNPDARRVIAVQALPIAFEPNVGQAAQPYRFVAHQNGMWIGFGNQQVGFSLASSDGNPSRLRLSFEAPNPRGTVSAEHLLPGRVNYLRGNPSTWKRGVPTFERLRYRDLYPGIDLVFYGNGREMEHDFVLSPDAQPDSISMRVGGMHATSLSPAGHLILEFENGESIEFRKPIAYQETAHGRVEVAVSYRVAGQRVGFSVGAYDRSLSLIIDPVLDYSTYLANDSAVSAAVATDSQGNTYITGDVFDPGYPVTTNAFERACGSCAAGKPDVFVTKLTGDGSAQVYSTFLGGSDYDQPFGLAVDGNGDAVVVGRTSSQDFPVKNSIQTTTNGYAMTWGFITSLSPDGSSLNYSSVLGSVANSTTSATTIINAVALDSSGNAYFTGTTDDALYPITAGALKKLTPGYPESAVFVTKVLRDGTLGYSAIVGNAEPQNGGGGLIGPGAICVDSSGSAYIYGNGGSLWPITAGAYQPNIPGTAPYAAPFVTKLAGDGSGLVYSTFVGNNAFIGGIAVNSSGQAVLTGWGADSAYPTTADAMFPTYPSDSGFGFIVSWLTILNDTGTGLVYSSFLTGGDATSNALALDSTGNIWVAGKTGDNDFPLVHPVKGLPGFSSTGSEDGFVMQFDPTGKYILFSSYFGTFTAGSRITSIAVDSAGKTHITGSTQSDLYTTPNAFQSTVAPLGPNFSIPWSFAAKIDASAAAPSLCIAPPSNRGVGFYFVSVGTSATNSVTVVNCGTQSLMISSITVTNPVFSIPAAENHCGSQIIAGGSCTLVVQFTPTAAVTTTAKLQFASNASIPVAELPLYGTGAVPVIQVTLSTSSLTFDSEDVGTPSASQSLRLTNIGTGTLSLTNITITGPFAFTSGCGSSVAPAANCSISVTFTPTATGGASGTLSILDNAVGSPQTVSLSGTGTAPTVRLGPAPGGATAATVTAGQTATYNLSIAGSPGFSGQVTFACTGAPMNAVCSVSPASTNLPKGGTAPFSVSVTTQATVSASLSHNSGWAALAATLAICGMPLVIVIGGRSRKRAMFSAIVAIGLATFAWTGCGDGSQSSPPPWPTAHLATTSPGTYTLTVTATSGSVSTSQALTLTVH